jgi:hypothetical protein
MNDLSTIDYTDITSQIGALELGDRLESYGDGVLEMAGPNATGPTMQANCTLPRGCWNL